jgi:hypothetical protein
MKISKMIQTPFKHIILIISLIFNLTACSNNESKSNSLRCKMGYLLSRKDYFSEYHCVKIPKEPFVKIQLPTPFKCSQGNTNLKGSHSHDGILYAIDLLSLPNAKAATIHAAHSGIAYIFDECKNRNTAYNANKIALDNCGTGYGNHVKILSNAGYLTIYAHLSHIYIKHKQRIKRGDIIGLEGSSGNAGLRHLHFGVSIPKKQYELEKTTGYTETSVPFRTIIKIHGKIQAINSLKFPCNDTLKKATLHSHKLQ